MRIKIKLSLIFIGLAFNSFSQLDTAKNISAIKACEVNLLFGSYYQSQQVGTIAEFQKLAPGSKLLMSDFSGYNQSGNSWTNFNGQFAANIGFKFANKGRTSYKPNPILRLGFSYFNITDLSSSLVKNSSFRSDTLVSINNGSNYYIDSMITRSYFMSHNSDQVRLDISLLFRSNPKARWQFFAGVGLTAGGSLNANTTINYNVYNDVYSADRLYNDNPYYYPYSNSNSNYLNEYFRNGFDLGFSLNAPLGIDFRMGKKRDFWKKLHLFYEVRPGIAVSNIGDLGTFANTSVQQGLGLKLNWE